jgi:hypothetical protein
MAGVYVQTNEANANRLLAFRRRDDGTTGRVAPSRRAVGGTASRT